MNDIFAEISGQVDHYRSIINQFNQCIMNISDTEFSRYRQWLYNVAGISLAPSKKALVCGRLAKRLRHFGISSYGEYLKILSDDHAGVERQTALDLLTTNETHFFREAGHFNYLVENILRKRCNTSPFRCWSAACSSGEEVYSLAMILADHLGDNASWEIVGSDISYRVLQKAVNGLYPIKVKDTIPHTYLQRFCLRGIGDQSGNLALTGELRKRVRFLQINLNRNLPDLGSFDVIFLRNVMIYFNNSTKKEVVSRLMLLLKPGGHLFIGHSETLNGVFGELQSVASSVYRKK